MTDSLEPEGFEGDFDPLFADDTAIDQNDMDDDNPYDTVDFPTMRKISVTRRCIRPSAKATRRARCSSSSITTLHADPCFWASSRRAKAAWPQASSRGASSVCRVPIARYARP